MNHLQHPQLVIPLVHSKAEEEAGIPLIHHTKVFILNKVAHFRFSQQNGRNQVSGYFLLLLGLHCLIPLLQPQLSLPAEHQNELDHGLKIRENLAPGDLAELANSCMLGDGMDLTGAWR